MTEDPKDLFMFIRPRPAKGRDERDALGKDHSRQKPCPSKHLGLYCTRPLGHKGDHVAGALGNLILGRWSES